MDLQSLIGKKIGRLTVTKYIGIRTAKHKDRIRNKYFYLCKCDCGRETKVNGAALKNKTTLSCGCFQKEQVLKGHEKQRGKARPQVQKPNGISVSHTIFLAYKGGAKKRNINFDLSETKFEELTTQNCFYCNSEPREIKKNPKDHVSRKMNGIDRIDSTIGYTVSNCVTCCKICNYMKQELSNDDFFEHIKKIVDHNGLWVIS